MKPYMKTSYDDHTEESDNTGLVCPEETKTQQHDEHDANINNIVATYLRTGTAEFHNRPPLTEDFNTVTSMQDAMQLIVDARVAFMEQPASVRARFHNDPAEFVEFCSNEDNRDDMRKMGLLSQEENDRYQHILNMQATEAAANRRDAEAFRKAQEAPKS